MGAFRRRSMLPVTPDRGAGFCPHRCLRAAGSRPSGTASGRCRVRWDRYAQGHVGGGGDRPGRPAGRPGRGAERLERVVRVGGWLAAHRVTRVGVEGSGNYGRRVAAYLVLDWDQPPRCGVVKVPTLMASRERGGARPGKGKTVPVDAFAIARITMREHDLPSVRLASGEAADLQRGAADSRLKARIGRPET